MPATGNQKARSLQEARITQNLCTKEAAPHISDEAIRTRLLIAEQRERMSLPGDADRWLEARRQLLAEVGS